MKETLKLLGHVKVQRFDEHGTLVQQIDQPNLVTTVGKELIASLIADAVVTATSHMAVGDSSTAPTIADTTLTSELGRVALTSTTPSSNVVTYLATFPAGTGTGTLREAGLFNAGVAGTMLTHTLFAADVPKGAGDSVTITWTLTVS